MPERLPVRANFVIELPGEPAITGQIDFIARFPAAAARTAPSSARAAQ